MKKRRRQMSEASLSFLDIISCGFGAIVLLLVITKLGDPVQRAEVERKAIQAVKVLQESLFDTQRGREVLVSELESKKKELDRIQKKIGELKKQSEERTAPEIRDDNRPTMKQMDVMAEVFQEEIQRLKDESIVNADNQVGGIPMNDEYILFLIDASGSMRNIYQLVNQQFSAILETYPIVKGIQVISNDGSFLFPATEGKWLEDSPAQRQEILGKYSLVNDTRSNPSKGLLEAVNIYIKQDKDFCIFVLGDDFEGGDDIGPLIKTIDKIKERNPYGVKVRIHGMGFPTKFADMEMSSGAGYQYDYQAILRYAAVMRNLSSNNNGAFIGLNTLETCDC